MTRPSNRHLDAAELDALVLEAKGQVSGADSLTNPVLEEVRRHVESCTDCSLRIEMHRSAQNDILRSGGRSDVTSGPNCLGDVEWFQVAAGLEQGGRSRELVQHAAQCEHCGPLLKSAAEILSNETTADEEQVLASLSSRHPEWQKALVQRLQTGKEKRGFFNRSVELWRGWAFWPRLVFATAALTMVVAALWLGQRAFRQPSVDQLLAQAYTQNRTVEIRISGARYAPLRVERKTNGSTLDKSPSLLKAEAVIGENLSKKPNDPEWLEARGRAELLDSNYDSAIKSLERALAAQPDSPSILTDLGSAYFLRAESADQANDYQTAIERLGKALAKSPDDPVALFNRALVEEKIPLYDQAVRDWEAYLRLDPQGGWADEARGRLAALKQRMGQHARSLAEPLMSPEDLSQAVESGGEAYSRADERAEEYLALAVRQWLPAAYPFDQNTAADIDQPQLRLALRKLSTLLAKSHGDPWLSDLLEDSGSTALPRGMQALSRAFRANEEGDPDTGLAEAQRALELFHNAGSNAGESRAALEEIYALHRKYHLQECLSQISNIENAEPGHKYPWIAIQLQLEHYACAGASASEVQRLAAARQGAQRAGYGSLYLRAVGFTASLDTDLGDNERAWRWDRAGLEKYWSGPYPPLRAQHFYDDMSIAAEDASHWRFAIAVEKEAVAAISESPNRSGEGMERIKLARSETEAHLWADAKQQYSLALLAFRSLADDKSTRAFRATAEIGLAEVAVSQQRWEEAEVHLRYARGNMPGDFESSETWMALYGTVAELRHHSGDGDGERRACMAAVRIAETALFNVHSELDRLRWNRSSSQCYRELANTELLKNDNLGALEWWEHYRSAGLGLEKNELFQVSDLAALDSSQSLQTPKEVEEELSSISGETVIAYAEIGDQVNAWVYDNRGVYWQPLKLSPSALEMEAANFANLCADPQSDPALLRADGRRLYDALVRPLVDHLDPVRTLVIEADRGISAIPFSALVDPEGAYLADHFQVAYLPGVGYRHLLRESAPITGEEAALVVGPAAIAISDQSRYPPLPDALGEAAYVAAQFRHSVLISGLRATLANVSDRLEQARVFHFAGHTQSEAGHSGLLLAPQSGAADERSSVLTADRIDSSQLPMLRLAVLSACSTQGDVADSSDSLAGAFLRRGVPNVVATRWPLDSTVSAMFMRVFYQNARATEVAAAFTAAARQIRSIPQFRHPYYWAVFALFGRGVSPSADREPA